MASVLKQADMNREEAQATCDTIRRGMNDVRDLVLDLHDRRGWLALGYGSWRDCVVAEFDQSKSHLYRQLDAARIEREISPIGEKLGRVPEGQLRPLTIVPEGRRAEVWEEAKATAPAGKVTAKHVRETVDRKLGKAPVTPKPEPEPEPTCKTRVNGRVAPDPPDVARARAEGRIPAGVIVEVTEPEPTEEPIEPAPADPAEAELADEEWLATLPLRSRLEGRQRGLFDADALTYRRLAKPRDTFRHHATRVLNAARRKGEYGYRVMRFLGLDHPRHWLVCPAVDNGGCGGTGDIPLIGQCPKCRGRGYWIK